MAGKDDDIKEEGANTGGLGEILGRSPVSPAAEYARALFLRHDRVASMAPLSHQIFSRYRALSRIAGGTPGLPLVKARPGRDWAGPGDAGPAETSPQSHGAPLVQAKSLESVAVLATRIKPVENRNVNEVRAAVSVSPGQSVVQREKGRGTGAAMPAGLLSSRIGKAPAGNPVRRIMKQKGTGINRDGQASTPETGNVASSLPVKGKGVIPRVPEPAMPHDLAHIPLNAVVQPERDSLTFVAPPFAGQDNPVVRMKKEQAVPSLEKTAPMPDTVMGESAGPLTVFGTTRSSLTGMSVPQAPSLRMDVKTATPVELQDHPETGNHPSVQAERHRVHSAFENPGPGIPAMIFRKNDTGATDPKPTDPSFMAAAPMPDQAVAGGSGVMPDTAVHPVVTAGKARASESVVSETGTAVLPRVKARIMDSRGEGQRPEYGRRKGPDAGGILFPVRRMSADIQRAAEGSWPKHLTPRLGGQVRPEAGNAAVPGQQDPMTAEVKSGLQQFSVNVETPGRSGSPPRGQSSLSRAWPAPAPHMAFPKDFHREWLPGIRSTGETRVQASLYPQGPMGTEPGKPVESGRTSPVQRTLPVSSFSSGFKDQPMPLGISQKTVVDKVVQRVEDRLSRSAEGVPGVESAAQTPSTPETPSPAARPAGQVEGGQAPGDIKALADQVYDLIMERLSVERESLGL